MRIAMVSINTGAPARSHDGDPTQRVVVDGLSHALSALGHNVTVFTRQADAALATQRQPHLPSDEAAAFIAGLTQQWQADPPDVIHAYSWQSVEVALAAARPFGCPMVQTFLGVARSKGRPSADKTALLRGAARIIAMSSADVFGLLGMGANPGAIKLIPCGVDLERFTPEMPASPVRRPFRVATLGRLCVDEGVTDVIEALRYLPEVELLIGGGSAGAAELGSDAEVGALYRVARAHGVETRVRICGRIDRDDVPAFLRSADLVVCAPRNDSIGTVALEAMACGVPAIVSAVGGLVDVVADGMTGLHVPPGQPRQLAYAIDSLAGDRGRRERFARLGAERTAARYGWARIAAETLEVYRSVAAPNALTTTRSIAREA